MAEQSRRSGCRMAGCVKIRTPLVRHHSARTFGGDMRRLTAILALFLTLLCAAGFSALRTRTVKQQQCLNGMRQLDSAAIQYCLEQRLSPTSVLSLATLSPYLKPSTPCPSGQSDYLMSRACRVHVERRTLKGICSGRCTRNSALPTCSTRSPNQRIEPMRRSAFAFISISSADGAVPPHGSPPRWAYR